MKSHLIEINIVGKKKKANKPEKTRVETNYKFWLYIMYTLIVYLLLSSNYSHYMLYVSV